MYPKPCRNCARILRPAGTSAEDYPTSEIPHHANGICRTCYRYHYRHGEYPTPELIEKQTRLGRIRHENNVAGLNNFLARIRGKSRLKVTR